MDVVSEFSFDERFLLFESVISSLGLVLIVISLGGVFNTVLLETRQRVRETAVLKTIGMTHRQVVAMVIASIAPIGVVAGLLGVPLGLAFQRIVLRLMGEAASNTGVPESAFDVFPVLALVALGLAGLAIGALGAWVPAQRAARARSSRRSRRSDPGGVRAELPRVRRARHAPGRDPTTVTQGLTSSSNVGGGMIAR